MLRRLILPAGISLALAFMCAGITLAVTEEQAAHLLAAQKIFEPSAKIHVSISHSDALVLVQSPEIKRTEPAALKIDAALVAKTVMDADKSIKKVTSRFYPGDQSETYNEVSVRALEVELYGEGKISRDQLLSSLDLVEHLETSQEKESAVKQDDLTVAPGPFPAERLKLLRRIEALKKQGVGVKPFTERFAQLEEEAKADKTSQLKTDLGDLEDKVTDQETFLRNRSLVEQQRPPLQPQPQLARPPLAFPAGNSEDLYSTLAAAAGRYDPRLNIPRGPRLLERAHVTKEIIELEQHGADVHDLKPIMERMNAYAVAHDVVNLDKALNILRRHVEILQRYHGGHEDHHPDAPHPDRKL